MKKGVKKVKVKRDSRTGQFSISPDRKKALRLVGKHFSRALTRLSDR